MSAPPGAQSPHAADVPCVRHERYDMNCSEYEALRARASGHCEACGTPEEETSRERLVIDHDHRYGWAAVRGLLCDRCNGQLGQYEHGLLTEASERALQNRFRAYFDKAWFVQVAAWARTQGGLMEATDSQSPHIIDAVLRARTVKAVTRRLGQPEIRFHAVPGPGPLRCAVRAIYSFWAFPYRTLTVHLTYCATGNGPGSPRQALVEYLALGSEQTERHRVEPLIFEDWREALAKVRPQLHLEDIEEEDLGEPGEAGAP